MKQRYFPLKIDAVLTGKRVFLLRVWFSYTTTGEFSLFFFLKKKKCSYLVTFSQRLDSNVLACSTFNLLQSVDFSLSYN